MFYIIMNMKKFPHSKLQYFINGYIYDQSGFILVLRVVFLDPSIIQLHL